jgi:hypothetical protein
MFQFGREMAAPDLRMRTPKGTGANNSNKKCEWKHGVSAVGREAITQKDNHALRK